MARTGRPRLDVDWVGARSAVESGVSMEKVAAKFGIKIPTLRKTAQRQEWLLPSDIEKAVAKAQTNLSSTLSRSLSRESRIELLAETWAEKGENLRQLAYTKALNSLKTANLKPASNARDFEILDKVARRAAGLDTADNQVSLSFSLPGWGQNARVFDADSGAYSGPSSEEESSESPTAIEDRGDS
jgi:hypothetical protein